jgi:uncharacterized membrane protein
MRKVATIALSSVALMVLAACTGGIPATVANPGDPPAMPSATPSSTPELADVSPAGTEAVQDAEEQVPPPEPSATPTARPGLEATDPESVHLASGKPTLLEFFAFW